MQQIQSIIQDYGQYIYNFAFKLSCSPENASDIAQETFITAWKNIESIRDNRAIKSWLRTICLNIFLQSARRSDNKKLVFLDETAIEDTSEKSFLSDNKTPLPEEEVIVEESIREMQNGCFYAMVRRLTLEQRIAFSLIDMFGMSIKEVSELFDTTEGGIKSMLYRARMNLDSFFADHCNIIQVENPCSCKAWQEFWMNKHENQNKMRKAINNTESLDFTKKKYTFNPLVRSKIHYLYSHMSEKKADKKWFENVIQAVSLTN